MKRSVRMRARCALVLAGLSGLLGCGASAAGCDEIIGIEEVDVTSGSGGGSDAGQEDAGGDADADAAEASQARSCDEADSPGCL